ncbi:hypothetical protein NDU88_004281 [Pleurodeles waltl]|uniref:Reverse transcriptase domain-containing protein n=1 Tax=Pleurodeles waltl TaxID=8319 RepID=A0AAV7UG25_PLEWA|nr:hypothetical protein NDU88_004281 [Pleurodeles waltl]
MAVYVGGFRRGHNYIFFYHRPVGGLIAALPPTARVVIRAYISRQYAEGDRAGRLLAWLVRQNSQPSPIGAIRLDSGTIVNSQVEMNDAFYTYYRSLYSSPLLLLRSKWLTSYSLPPRRCLQTAQADVLEGPICMEEMCLALSRMAHNKALASDGLTVEYFASQANHLLQPLLWVFNEAYDRVKLPDSMCEALIVMLPKPGRDPLEVRSYRPLSLLNSDFKVLRKILANRLLPFLPQLIHEDLSGFIPGRNTFPKISRLLRIIHNNNPESSPRTVALSLDIEKAFYTLSWDFLIETLGVMGFGAGYI